MWNKTLKHLFRNRFEERHEITIDDLRSLVRSKIPDSRSDIKKWLYDRGYSNLTKVPTDEYEILYDFLKNL